MGSQGPLLGGSLCATVEPPPACLGSARMRACFLNSVVMPVAAAARMPGLCRRERPDFDVGAVRNVDVYGILSDTLCRDQAKVERRRKDKGLKRARSAGGACDSNRHCLQHDLGAYCTWHYTSLLKASHAAYLNEAVRRTLVVPVFGCASNQRCPCLHPNISVPSARRSVFICHLHGVFLARNSRAC